MDLNIIQICRCDNLDLSEPQFNNLRIKEINIFIKIRIKISDKNFLNELQLNPMATNKHT